MATILCFIGFIIWVFYMLAPEPEQPFVPPGPKPKVYTEHELERRRILTKLYGSPEL